MPSMILNRDAHPRQWRLDLSALSEATKQNV